MSVRLSVRPSVTRRYSVETAKYIFKLSSLSGSDTTLVEIVQHQTVWQYSDCNPTPSLTGRRMQGGMRKLVIFDQYLVLSRKRYKIEP